MTTTDSTEAPKAPEAPEPTTQPTTSTPNHEAAKYRVKLRETETERDVLVAAVTTLRRAEVERLATDGRVLPAAFWLAGNDVADLLTESGAVDPEKVNAAITATRETLGIPHKPMKSDPAAQGNQGPPIASGPPEASWQNALRRS